jgi:hypothetical protein
MKKIYFLVLTFCFFNGLSAQIVDIPDANFKALLLSSNTTNSIAKGEYNQSLKIDANNNGEIEVSEALLVKELNFGFFQYNYESPIRDLKGIQSFINLEYLSFQFLPKLTSVNLNTLTKLKSLSISNCSITSFNASLLTNLEKLSCYNNQLTSLDIHGLNKLTDLECVNNNLTSLDARNLLNLHRIDCGYNKLNDIKFTNSLNLGVLICNDNNLTKLDLSESNITLLYCDNNKLESLNLINSKLTALQVMNNSLTSLDLSYLYGYFSLDCSNNPLLKSLNLKNGWLTQVAYNAGYDVYGNPVGVGSESYVNFDRCPALEYICDDDFDFNAMKKVIDQYEYTNCSLNSYCSFKPGGTNYSIHGANKIDVTKNGCDPLDIIYPNLKFAVSGVTGTSSYISNGTGAYNISVPVGTHIITPILENPYYFSISPINTAVTFPTQNSPYNQDFCITPNGSRTDLEVTILPTNSARPGFDSTYKIIYKNKGNTIQSGTVSLEFDDEILDLISINPSASSQTVNNLSWSFSNLKPFDSSEINIFFNLNGPTETPAVNIGRILKYSANIGSLAVDETPIDNKFILNQTVVGSLDPNDKTCLEGDIITPSLIGEYVHYIIRFENTGTYPAQNIVVKDMIDLSKFDISTLIPTSSSHSYITKISEGNKVEFIFENVNLPFDDANNDGYIAFKIKTLPTLVTGDSFDNEANIYFDYNFPVLTNKATSTFKATLDTSDFEFSNYFSVYPIPVHEVLNIATKKDIKIQSIAVYDILGQLVIALPNIKDASKIDISNLRTGNYFLKIKSDKGSSSLKFIKN